MVGAQTDYFVVVWFILKREGKLSKLFTSRSVSVNRKRHFILCNRRLNL